MTNAYAEGDPVNLTDPSGLCDIFGNCWSEAANDVGQAAEDVGHAANAALPVVHDISSDVAAAASLCAVVTSETIIGGATCGTIATVAGGVSAASGLTLYAEGRESGTLAAVDLASAGAGGLAALGEVGAAALSSSAESADSISFLFQDESEIAPWLERSSALDSSEAVLAIESRVFGIVGAGFGIYGQFPFGWSFEGSC